MTTRSVTSVGHEIDPEQKLETPLFEDFVDRLKSEHDLIGHRMTWLMTLNGFLIGGVAVLTANHDEFQKQIVLTSALMIICIVGALSNASCLFSNWWATKAIRETADALSASWTVEEHGRYAKRMRIYGRDPRSFRGPDRALPSEWLHPWLLLPTVFILLAFLTGFFATAVSDDVSKPWWIRLLPLIISGIFFVPPIWLDKAAHRKRENEYYIIRQVAVINSEGRKIATSRERWKTYREERKAVRSWLKKDASFVSAQGLKKPRPYGIIPTGTYEAYQAQRLSQETEADRNSLETVDAETAATCPTVLAAARPGVCTS